MQLSEYLTVEGVTQAAFARAINESPVSVGRYVNGARIPEEEVMRKIFSATAGQVTANDFYGLPEKNGHSKRSRK